MARSSGAEHIGCGAALGGIGVGGQLQGSSAAMQPKSHQGSTSIQQPHFPTKFEK